MAEVKTIPVRVALRSRPLIREEISKGCLMSLSFVPNEPQVILGQDKAFTFDYVFPCDSRQDELYNSVVSDRIDYMFKGYNVTVLAYGQTGSGKTYTMGTSSKSSDVLDSSSGVIQRVVRDIFYGIKERSQETNFSVKVSFLEVYNEDVYDLLQKKSSPMTIREDYEGIKIQGLTELPVKTALETNQLLEQGSVLRTTASTAMNARSSRSHAIFTIIMEQISISDPLDIKKAKFHLVDLAGSERARKTMTCGERFKEGININLGLLSLGNVISALCDDAFHVPYRDSKLTRLLQDSLGGNSHTIMIACVSPADFNYDETLNTLRYADRARKIKNKPIVNVDPHNSELIRLRQQVQQLQSQLLQKQPLPNKGPSSLPSNDVQVLLEHIKTLEAENQNLKNASDLIFTTQAAANKGTLPNYLKELHGKVIQTIDNLVLMSQDNPELLEKLQLLQQWENKIVEIQTQNRLSSDSYEEDGDCDSDADYDMKLALKQAAMSKELEELDDALAQKEEQASKMKESNVQMEVMRIQFETNLKSMEEAIMTLQREKEDLNNALKAAQSSNNANKLSEQRRVRLRELESKINDMKKEVAEKSRLLRIRQETEHKVNKLQQEIQTMKSTRVKLLKQIKEEGERYRTLQKEKEREVAQLKQKDRKRQYEMTKLQDDFNKQKIVLKRKMEEATAANKRLNEALKQQRNVAERRLNEKNVFRGMAERVEQWLKQEIEVLLTSKEAKYHLKVLQEDHNTIQGQINILKRSEQSAGPPQKKRSMGDADNIIDPCHEIRKEIEALNSELEIRNQQITELRQQIQHADQAEKLKHRWETLQSIVEAKCALKYLFESHVGVKHDFFLKQSQWSAKEEKLEADLTKLQSLIQSTTASNSKLAEHARLMEAEQAKEISKLIENYEKRITYLLKQLNTTDKSDASVNPSSELLSFEAIKIASLESLQSELHKRNLEIASLKKQLESAKSKGRKPQLMPKIYNTEPKLNETVIIKSHDDSAMAEFLKESSSEDEIDENDPEWRLTPHLKRNRSKINTSAGGCSCKVSCSTKRCKCNKQLKFCTALCKCISSCCTNQSENLKESDNNMVVKSSSRLETDHSKPVLNPKLNDLALSLDLNSSDEFIISMSPSKRNKRYI